MKSLFFSAVMMCGLALSQVHPAHADALQDALAEQTRAINDHADYLAEKAQIDADYRNGMAETNRVWGAYGCKSSRTC